MLRAIVFSISTAFLFNELGFAATITALGPAQYQIQAKADSNQLIDSGDTFPGETVSVSQATTSSFGYAVAQYNLTSSSVSFLHWLEVESHALGSSGWGSARDNVSVRIDPTEDEELGNPVNLYLHAVAAAPIGRVTGPMFAAVSSITVRSLVTVIGSSADEFDGLGTYVVPALIGDQVNYSGSSVMFAANEFGHRKNDIIFALSVEPEPPPVPPVMPFNFWTSTADMGNWSDENNWNDGGVLPQQDWDILLNNSLSSTLTPACPASSFQGRPARC